MEIDNMYSCCKTCRCCSIIFGRDFPTDNYTCSYWKPKRVVYDNNRR